MLLVGGFIDLFPFVVAAYGIIAALWAGINGSAEALILALLLIGTVALIILAIYLNRMLQGDACKRCPNFSCAMNKTSDEVRRAFLAKNPTMANAWKDEQTLSEE